MSRLVESLILLAATALVSGLLAPFVVNRIQVANRKRLKAYEADLARQSKIIEEQGALIQRLSGVLWEFQLTLIAPLYYGQPTFRASRVLSSSGQPHASPYQDAAAHYLANSGRLLGSIRAEIGGAVRLVPADQWIILKELYYNELLRLDLQVTQLILNGGPTEDNTKESMKECSYVLRDLAVILDKTVDGLAASLGLKYRTP